MKLGEKLQELRKEIGFETLTVVTKKQFKSKI